MIPEQRSKYVPHIDGLRALAVLSVIVYHLNEHWLPGGFSGVDIFFVISGFVVSASVAEIRTTTLPGFFGYFYARRILRIVPALVVCLVATHILTMLFVPWAWLSNANDRTGLYAFFGLSNFVLAYAGNDYFSPLSDFNPYTHTWSLGVEEQFYLVFPPLFVAWIAGGRWRRGAIVLFSLGLVASLVCAGWLARADKDLAFYSIFSRFWELAAGVLLYQVFAISGHSFSEKGRRATLVSRAGAFVSVLLIVAGFIVSKPYSYPFPGALLPVLGTLGLLASLQGREPRGIVMRGLSHPAVAFIGRISYSLYLWHWVVFVLFRWTIGLESVAARTIAVALTFALSVASYYFIELPPRRAPMLRRAPRFAVVVAGIVFVAGAAWASTRIKNYSTMLSLSTVTRHFDDWYPTHIRPVAEPNCTPKARSESLEISMVSVWTADACVRPREAMPRVFAIGDSHAVSYTGMLLQFVVETGADVRLYANAGCPFLSLQRSREAGKCPGALKVALADILARARPGDILFLPSLRLQRLSDQNARLNEEAAWQSMLGAPAVAGRKAAVAQAIEALQPFVKKGMRIVFDAPKPVLRAPPFRCSDWFNENNPICVGGLSMRRSELERYRAPVMAAFQEIARSVPGVSVWDAFPLLCPAEICEASMDGHPLYYDGDHISGYANRLLLPYFIKEVELIASAPSPRATDSTPAGKRGFDPPAEDVFEDRFEH
ncbi:MAG: acyltransferase family protein [Rhodanobacteraceae bacterium]